MANNDWGTPPELIESARKVMGSIDVDPASNDKANIFCIEFEKYGMVLQPFNNRMFL